MAPPGSSRSSDSSAMPSAAAEHASGARSLRCARESQGRRRPHGPTASRGVLLRRRRGCGRRRPEVRGSRVRGRRRTVRRKRRAVRAGARPHGVGPHARRVGPSGSGTTVGTACATDRRGWDSASLKSRSASSIRPWRRRRSARRTIPSFANGGRVAARSPIAFDSTSSASFQLPCHASTAA
jgi:hypothetical protein